MKKKFAKPFCEVVRLGQSDIVTASVCFCNVEGTDFGPGADECVGKNNPACICGLIDEVNCVDP